MKECRLVNTNWSQIGQDVKDLVNQLQKVIMLEKSLILNSIKNKKQMFHLLECHQDINSFKLIQMTNMMKTLKLKAHMEWKPNMDKNMSMEWWEMKNYKELLE